MPRSPTIRHGASRRASHKSLGKSLLLVVELVELRRADGGDTNLLGGCIRKAVCQIKHAVLPAVATHS